MVVEPGQTPFEEARIITRESESVHLSPRSYTLALSPNVIYSRSMLLPTLISSKVHKQLEFQAVGSWWIYRPADGGSGSGGFFYRVPSSREDVFSDDSISVKGKRTLMRFLRHIGGGGGSTSDDKVEKEEEKEEDNINFQDYLATKFHIPTELSAPLLSLSLSQSSPQETSAGYAVRRIQRHLSSIGVFGPGFGSLVARWGGDSEICQVACRSLAVGGGVYILGTGVVDAAFPDEEKKELLTVQLSGGYNVKTRFLVGSDWDLPANEQKQQQRAYRKVARSITIVSSPLQHLFPRTAADDGPVPAAVVVIFPGQTLGLPGESPSVYLQVHSSDTSECPVNQCKFLSFSLFLYI